MDRDEIIATLIKWGFVCRQHGRYERKQEAHFLAKCFEDHLQLWHGDHDVSCLYANRRYADLTPGALALVLAGATHLQVAEAQCEN